MRRINIDFAFLELRPDECAANLHIQTSSESFAILMSESDLASLLNDYLESCIDGMTTSDVRVPARNVTLIVQGIEYSFPDSVISGIIDDIGDLAERCSEKSPSRLLN